MQQRKDEAVRIGGQAVIEGVMMRSPSALVVAVRRPDGSVATRRDRSLSWTKRNRLFGLPVVRGGIVLVQTLVEGMKALSWSADQAAEGAGEEIGQGALAATMAMAFALAIGFFVVLPHYLTILLGRLFGTALTVEMILFHLVDGVLKLLFFLAYLVAISRWGEIRRVFEYHGAEHKSIAAWEKGGSLTVDAARGESTRHPRCGTTFLLTVLVISIVLFTVLVPLLLPAGIDSPFLRNLAAVAVKIVLMFPVAGLGYEFVRLAGRFPNNPVMRFLSAPGLLLQALTTREPDDSQIEIAQAALQAVLEMEAEKP